MRGIVGIIWSAPLPGRDVGLTVPGTDGDHVYMVYGGAGIVAVRASDGGVLWREPLEVYIPAKVAVRNDLVFAAESVVVARDARTGALRWRFTPDDNTSHSRLAVDVSAVYFGTADTSHTLYAVSAAEGRLLWRTKLGPDWEFRGWVRGVSVAGDTVYAAVTQYLAQNGHMSSAWTFALDRSTGRILWSHQSGAGSPARSASSEPAVSGDRLLVSDRAANAAYALDRFTGQEVWRTEFDRGYVGPIEPPVVVDGIAYVGAGDGHLYALDAASGRVLWRTNVEASIEAVAVCGDLILVQMHGLAVIHRATGRLLRTLLVSDDEGVTSGFAILGKRVFASSNKAMYMLECR